MEHLFNRENKRGWVTNQWCNTLDYLELKDTKRPARTSNSLTKRGSKILGMRTEIKMGHKRRIIKGEEGGRWFVRSVHGLMRIHARASFEENNGAYLQVLVLCKGSM